MKSSIVRASQLALVGSLTNSRKPRADLLPLRIQAQRLLEDLSRLRRSAIGEVGLGLRDGIHVITDVECAILRRPFARAPSLGELENADPADERRDDKDDAGDLQFPLRAKKKVPFTDPGRRACPLVAWKAKKKCPEKRESRVLGEKRPVSFGLCILFGLRFARL